MPFTHEIWPLAVNRSRGIVRIYWEAQDRTATQRFGREYAMNTLLEVHAEDHPIVESSQRGLDSGAAEVIHFQAQEVMNRHFFNAVSRTLQAYKAATDRVEEKIA
jgi:hypothetical protein